MKTKTLLVTLSVLIGCTLCAEPVETARRCPVCHGKRSLSITPPNLGQYDGEIGVTPGKPFTTHRWDVKIARCPICDGTGRQVKYQMRVKPPAPEEAEGYEACPDCRWSGVTPCRKCLGTGLQACRDCKSGARGGKPGWIRSERRTAGATSRHVKILVTPCGTCQGLGKVVCPDCLGRGAVPCRHCRGTGSLPQKEKR